MSSSPFDHPESAILTAANNNDESSLEMTIHFDDLALAMGIDEEELLERMAVILSKRSEDIPLATKKKD